MDEKWRAEGVKPDDRSDGGFDLICIASGRLPEGCCLRKGMPGQSPMEKLFLRKRP